MTLVMERGARVNSSRFGSNLYFSVFGTSGLSLGEVFHSLLPSLQWPKAFKHLPSLTFIRARFWGVAWIWKGERREYKVIGDKSSQS